MSGAGFENIPGSGLVAPLLTFELTSGGTFESPARELIVGHKNTGASIPLNTPTPVSSHSEVRQIAGVGSMLEDKFRVARLNAPAQEIWVMAIEDTGTAAVWTLTVASLPAQGIGIVEIGGDPVAITVASGDAVNDVAAALSAAINAYYDELSGTSLQVTASVTGAVVTVTARHKGAIFNDLDFHIPPTGNVFAGNVNIAATVAGVGDPDCSAGLAVLGDNPFDWQSWTFSDATNRGRYRDAMDDVSGQWSYLQQIYGHIVGAVPGTTSEVTTIGLSENDRHKTMIHYPNGAGGTPTPPWRWDAAILSRVVPWLVDGALGNVSRNQTGLIVKGIRPPRDPANNPDYPTRNAFNKSAISTWHVTASGQVAVDKLVTMFRLDPQGLPDSTFRDIQSMGQMMYALRRFRSFLAAEHGQKALADTNPTDLGSISTPKDVEGTMYRVADTMPGVLENARFIVARNPDNANRIDIMANLDRVNALDVMAGNARLYSQFTEANGLA